LDRIKRTQLSLGFSIDRPWLMKVPARRDTTPSRQATSAISVFQKPVIGAPRYEIQSSKEA